MLSDISEMALITAIFTLDNFCQPKSSFAKSLMEYQNLQSEMVKIRMKLDSIKLTGSGLTKQIGQQFKLVGLEDTAGRLLKIVNEMLLHHENPEDSFRYEGRPHEIRIVAVPGLGKVSFFLSASCS